MKKEQLQSKFDLNKEYYLPVKDANKYAVGDSINYAPFSTRLQVLEVYHSNWFKRRLIKLGLSTRINQIKAVRLY